MTSIHKQVSARCIVQEVRKSMFSVSVYNPKYGIPEHGVRSFPAFAEQIGYDVNTLYRQIHAAQNKFEFSLELEDGWVISWMNAQDWRNWILSFKAKLAPAMTHFTVKAPSNPKQALPGEKNFATKLHNLSKGK